MMEAVKIIFFVLVLAAVGYFGYDYYLSYSGSQPLSFELGKNISAPNELTQFVPDMRFESGRISYYINTDCSLKQKINMIYAMDLLTNATDIISFYTKDKDKAEIFISCSEVAYSGEKDVFAAGEAKPTEYLNLTYYPLIKKGKITISKQFNCDYPVLEMHELMHVFGFDHLNDSTSLMYPYADCNRTLDKPLIKMLKTLYADKPVAELLLENIKVSKSQKYLNFTLDITNQGLKVAEGVVLEVYVGKTLIDSGAVGTVEIGQPQLIGVNNIPLPSGNFSTTDFRIVYSGEEFDKTNNILTV